MKKQRVSHAPDPSITSGDEGENNHSSTGYGESKKSMASFMDWPLQTFDIMMSPLTLWMERILSQRPDGMAYLEQDETPDAYIFRMTLPGISADQLELHIMDGKLIVHADMAGEAKSGSYHVGANRSIDRALPLPVYINGTAIEAVLKNGMLTLTLPKSVRPVVPKIGPLALN